MKISKPYLISSKDLTLNDIELIFKRADYYKDAPKGEVFDELKNFSVCTMFLEPSTRTKLSFELAAKRLSATVLDFDLSSTSYLKGETLLDTLHTLEAMGVNFIISRNSEYGISKYFVNNSNSYIINAGEGTLDHPTQGLLDAYTLSSLFEDSSQLKGKKICIVGDVRHSRVAKSNFEILDKLGMEISTCSPVELTLEESNYPNYSNLEHALQENQIIMMLRIQRERIKNLERFDFDRPDNLEWYREKFALTEKRALAHSNCYFMHPGPANFGIEIDKDVEMHDNSLIRKQVYNGVLIRMAILSLLAREV